MIRLFARLLLCLLFFHGGVVAQVQILQPVPYLVVQRGADNSGRLYISGRTPAADRIDAQLTPVTPGQGTATGFQTIQSNPTGGLFLGSITATGGWYVLTVQAIRNGAVIGQTTIQPVGIGEVFITAGQSNSRGLGLGDNDLGTATGRVMSINAINHYQPMTGPIISSGDPLPVPVYSPLTAGHQIYPMAESSWGWGELGDYVVNRFNVPVVFYNAGWDASTVENWLSTANGTPACNRYYCPDDSYRWLNLQPYTNLKNVLQYYGSMGGVRAVLWHQGEAEYCYPGNCSVTEYANRLTALVQKSRQDAGNSPIPWVVARVSFDGNSTNPDVVAQQQNIINTVGNVFRGPLNDTIINRNAGGQDVHFKNSQRPVTHPQYYLNPNSIPADMGLSRFARNWNNSLDNTFFQTATPVVTERFVATGNVTTNITPNALINVPVASLGAFGGDNQWQVQLLDTQGNYLRVLGTSGANPVPVTWPVDLASGQYRLRVVSTNPVVMGVPTPVFCVGCATDVSLSMTADRRTVSVADLTTFTIRLRNAGPVAATNVVVQDRLPPNMAVTSANRLTLSNGLLTGSVARIEVGATAVLSFQARVAAGTYINAAEILSADQTDPDSQPGSGTGDGQDDAATVDVRTHESGGGLYVSPNPNQTPLPAVVSNQPAPDPNKADLSLSVWVDNRTPRLNDVLTYSVQVSNAGGQVATRVSVTAYLPTSQQFISGDDFTVGSGDLTAGLSSLAANGTALVRFRARVTAVGGGITKVQITIASPSDPDSTPANGTDNGEDDTAQADVRSR